MKDELPIIALLLTGLVLLYLVLIVHNTFKRWWLTFIRRLIAIGAGWIFWLSFVFVADALNRAAVTSEQEIESLNGANRAKFVSALVPGWVVPAFTVGVSWLFHCSLVPRLRNAAC